MSAAPTTLPGQYEIQNVLGAGTFGLVYLATDAQGQQCAIKEFPVAPTVAQQFFRELSMVFALDHPHIVRCQNLIYGGSGKSYLIFEFIGGGTLRNHLLEKERLTVTEALEMARQICLGLHHAHERGVVHRDLKPENILLEQSERPHFKIADLGIARFQSETRNENAGGGSPAYMAPEQFYGEFSVASDLYALGVILYEALAGQRPFEGAPASLFLLHSQTPPDLEVIADAPCRAILGRLLSKQPAARPASAAEVLAALEVMLQPESPAATIELVSDSAFVEPAPAPAGVFTGAIAVAGFETPGALALHPFFTATCSQLLVSDGTGSDLYEVESARYRPRFLTENTTAAASDGGRTGYFATKDYLRTFDPVTATVRLLFPHQTAVQSLAVSADGRQIFYASQGRLFCSGRDGRLLWQAPCPNYFHAPHLLSLADGSIVFSRGPARPAFTVCDPQGKVRYECDLEAPVLALRSEPASGGFSAVLLGLGADAPCRWLHFEDGKITAAQEIGTGLYHAQWHGGLLSLRCGDGSVQLRNAKLEIVWQYQSAGSVLADAWHPWLQRWVILERVQGRTWLRTWRLSALTACPEPTSPVTAQVA